MEREEKIALACGLAVAAILIGFLFASTFGAIARSGGSWDADPRTQKWVQGLMQPDNPYMSCCGRADAYWADSFDVENGQTVATITGERDDEPLGRPHRPAGTKVPIPDQKMKWDAGNPTGHGIVFIGTTGQVYCYVTPGGA